jgi:hypothetical protein
MITCSITVLKTLCLNGMSKRTVTEIQSPAKAEGQPFSKASASGSKRENVSHDEMGDFEDAWEDDIESDEEVVDADDAEDENGLPIFRVLELFPLNKSNLSCSFRDGYG